MGAIVGKTQKFMGAEKPNEPTVAFVQAPNFISDWEQFISIKNENRKSLKSPTMLWNKSAKTVKQKFCKKTHV